MSSWKPHLHPSRAKRRVSVLEANLQSFSNHRGAKAICSYFSVPIWGAWVGPTVIEHFGPSMDADVTLEDLSHLARCVCLPWTLA